MSIVCVFILVVARPPRVWLNSRFLFHRTGAESCNLVITKERGARECRSVAACLNFHTLERKVMSKTMENYKQLFWLVSSTVFSFFMRFSDFRFSTMVGNTTMRLKEELAGVRWDFKFVIWIRPATERENHTHTETLLCFTSPPDKTMDIKQFRGGSWLLRRSWRMNN